MNLTPKLLSSSISFALMAGLIAFPMQAAFAQEDAANDKTEKLDEVVVTGSRIRQVDAETAQPLLVIDREAIESQGFQSVADILSNISAAGSPVISRAQPLSAGEAVGGSFIDLRNLGATRTLVLINGRRLGITTGGLQDLSTIPAAMVERIEVLKDGASSLYGSDAIGGVINVITRTRFEGAESSVYYGQYDQGDGAVTKADGVLGFAGESGSITVGLEYTKEDEVAASDRDYSAWPVGPAHTDLGWTPVGQFGGFVASVGGAPGSTRLVVRPGGDPRRIADYIPQVTTGFVNGQVVGQVSNTLEQTTLRTPLEQRQLFVNTQYDITDNLELFSDILYSNRLASRQVAGFPLQAGANNVPMSIDSYFNPVGSQSGFATPRAITNWWRRGWEVPRVSDSELNTFRFTMGLRGAFDLGERRFDWDVSVLYNNNTLTQKSFGNFNLTNARLAVGPSYLNATTGRVECGTAAAPIAYGSGQGACVPFNPFVSFGVNGQGSLSDPLLQQFLFQTEQSTGDTETKIANANITASLMELWAGDLAFAAGLEYRKEKGEFVPDALSVTGNSTNLSALPTRGSYDLKEAYLELAVPLLVDTFLADELSLSLASRFSDFDSFGSVTNSKLGLTWRPTETLLIRGTIAEGFRAPTIANLFAGGSQTFSFYTDPCDTRFGSSANNPTTRARCAADPAIGAARAATFRQLQQGFVPGTTAAPQTPLAFFSGAANPNLQPEDSLSKSVGFVWSPGFLDGFNIAADLWKVRIGNTIVGDAPGTILSDCYVEGITSRCNSFTRDPVLGIVNSMRFGNRNAGFTKTQGFDLDLSYRFATDFGNFTVGSQSTYVDEYLSASVNNAQFATRSVGFGGTFRLRTNLNLTWNYESFGITWGARYYSSIRETCLNAAAFPDECSDPTYTAINPAQTRPTNVLGSNTFNDLQFRWTAPWDGVVAFGANNIFEREGPVLYSQPNSNVSYYGGFDIGRFWYVRYQQKF